LSRYRSLSRPFFGSCFTISLVLRSSPGAFFGFSVLIVLWISFSAKGFGCFELYVVSLRTESTSSSGRLSWGVNTSCKCFANRSAFSWSLLAHLLGGVVHLRIGEATDVGCLLSRMGFQIYLSCLERFAV
jgi:hypothetical protein